MWGPPLNAWFVSSLRRALCLLLLMSISATPLQAGPAGAPGVSPKRIKIGLHAPFTGASPLPATSLERGADLYFRWLERNGVKINGRYVDVVVKNDNSNPTQAQAACEEMVETDSVFLLVGVAGSYQMQACARYAKEAGVPYVSWGSTRQRMGNMPRYFATSMAHEQQAALAADLLIDKHDAKGQQNAVIWTNTPVEKAARDRFVAVMERRGVTVDLDRSVPKTAGSTHAATVAAEMRAAGIDNAFFLGRTTFWIQLENSSAQQGENVQWASVSPMLGTDGMLGTVCSQNNSDLKAAMLGPVPAFKDRNRFDDRHDKAMQAIYGENGDHTTWAGWALGKNIAKMFRAAPRSLTRRSFTKRVTEATIKTGISPALPYSKGGSFVAKRTHLLRADCSARRWNTARASVSDF